MWNTLHATGTAHTHSTANSSHSLVAASTLQLHYSTENGDGCQTLTDRRKLVTRSGARQVAGAMRAADKVEPRRPRMLPGRRAAPASQMSNSAVGVSSKSSSSPLRLASSPYQKTAHLEAQKPRGMWRRGLVLSNTCRLAPSLQRAHPHRRGSSASLLGRLSPRRRVCDVNQRKQASR